MVSALEVAAQDQKVQLVRRRGRLYVINKTNKRLRTTRPSAFIRPNLMAGRICFSLHADVGRCFLCRFDFRPCRMGA